MFKLIGIIAFLAILLPSMILTTKAGVSLVPPKMARLVTAAVVLVFCWTLGGSFGFVPSGDTGIKTFFGGKVANTTYGEGMYLVYPVVEEVHVLNTKTHTIELPELDANTNDRQTVQTQVSFNVQYDTAQAPAIYRQYRTTENFDKQIVIPRLVYAVKTITARYSAPDQIRLRPNVDADMIKFANDQLANTGASVTANGLQIGNFRYAADYQKAIEDTQVAQQNLIKSQNELKVAQIDARTRIAAAQGEAQSARLTAAANNATSLQSKFLDKWDGHLPTVMGNSGGNLLDVKTLMGSTH